MRVHVLPGVLLAALLLAGCTTTGTDAAPGDTATIGAADYQPPSGFVLQEDQSSGRAVLWASDASAWIAVTTTSHSSSRDAVISNFEQQWNPRNYLSFPAARWNMSAIDALTLGGTRWVAANATAVTSLGNASIAAYGTADDRYIYLFSLITERGSLAGHYPAFVASVRDASFQD